MPSHPPSARRESAEPATQRLDSWLWATRFFKTRQLAVTAIKGGKITVNGVRAKPAKAIRIGDKLSVQSDPYRYCIVVDGFSTRRLAANDAQRLYAETDDSRQQRKQRAEQLRADAALRVAPARRPDKRDRRLLTRVRRGE
ncbi:MAG: S4 domain-containing protein [Gammaproteobacteria bacterium]|nr:S4 domain-containing protein [Gammaproteobacteria bacterium]MDH3465312.1 S4 domain-containing protein [Gammaproteobacteria bacterium]